MNKKEKIKTILIKIFSSKIVIAIAIVLVIVGIVLINKPAKNKIERSHNYILLETHANEVSEWKYEIEDKTIVKLDKKKRSGDVEGKTQEGLIKEKYIFKGLKPGSTTIKFTFINTKNNSFYDTKEYIVTVDSNLKVNIKEKNKTDNIKAEIKQNTITFEIDNKKSKQLECKIEDKEIAKITNKKIYETDDYQTKEKIEIKGLKAGYSKMSCSIDKTKNSSNIDVKEYAVFVSKELIVVIKEITN